MLQQKHWRQRGTAEAFTATDSYSKGPSSDLSQARCKLHSQWPQAASLVSLSPERRSAVTSALSCAALPICHSAGFDFSGHAAITPHVCAALQVVQGPARPLAAAAALELSSSSQGPQGRPQIQVSAAAAPPLRRGHARALCQGCGQAVTVWEVAVVVACHQLLLNYDGVHHQPSSVQCCPSPTPRPRVLEITGHDCTMTPPALHCDSSSRRA